MNRKPFIILLFLFVSVFFSSCIQIVETLVREVSQNTGGTPIEESVYFSDGKKSSEWLFMFYMDGDNSLDVPIFSDLNEIESGLSQIPNYNRSNVRCVVLWDGVANGSHKQSHVYEVGPDTTPSLLGTNTYDIRGVDFLTENYEVDMSDYNTVKKFLNWVYSHYEAEHFVLQVADHGSGPGGKSSNRSMCQDTTNNNKLMSTQEFGIALKNCDFIKHNKKLDMLIFDICLGAGIEDAYEYKDYALYMLCSPNSTPGPGHNYEKMLKKFSSNVVDAKSFGVSVCEDFRNSYKGSLAGFKASLSNAFPLVDSFLYNFYGLNGRAPTITLIDLLKIETCATKMNTLAGLIKSDSASYKKFLSIDYSSSRFNLSIDGCSVSNGLVSDSYLYYLANESWLFDIGYFACKVSENSNGKTEVKNAAEEVKTALKNAIVFSWRDSLLTSSDRNLYSNLNTDNFFGITICSGGIIKNFDNTKSCIVGRTPSWYTSIYLTFLNDCSNWSELVNSWFN